MGAIVPVSSISTEGYSTLQHIEFHLPFHVSSFDDRPSRLFDGLEHIRLSIHVVRNMQEECPAIFASECLRWSAEESNYECVHGVTLPHFQTSPQEGSNRGLDRADPGRNSSRVPGCEVA